MKSHAVIMSLPMMMGAATAAEKVTSGTMPNPNEMVWRVYNHDRGPVSL